MGFRKKDFYEQINRGDIDAVLNTLQENIIFGSTATSGYFGKKVIYALNNEYAVKLADLLKRNGAIDLVITDERKRKGFDYDRTLLMSAAYFGADKLVEALLAAGADPLRTSKFGKDVFMSAISGGSLEIAKSVIRHGADPYLGNVSGKHALAEACKSGNSAMAEWLLNDFKFDLLKKCKTGVRPLQYAVMAGSLDIVKMLVERGVSVNETGPRSTTALSSAALRGDAKIFEYLLSVGAEHSRQDNEGKTAIFHGRYRPQLVDILKVFVDYGADINYRLPFNDTSDGLSGFTLLMCLAGQNNNYDAVRYLLEQGADTGVSVAGRKAVNIAADAKNTRFIELLQSFNEQKALEQSIHSQEADNGLAF